MSEELRPCPFCGYPATGKTWIGWMKAKFEAAREVAIKFRTLWGELVQWGELANYGQMDRNVDAEIEARLKERTEK